MVRVSARQMARASLTLPHHRAPAFAVAPFILTGYRPAYGRASRAAWSVLELHNETGSIWSHALAACFFTWATLTDELISRPVRACLSIHAALYWMSTIAHTFGAVSERVNRILFTMDKSMISAMFLSSGLCAASIEFAGKHVILGLVSAAMSVCCACVIRAICGPGSSKWINASFLGAQMLLAASPVAHLSLSGRDPRLAEQISLAAGRAILPSLFGGLAYALRLPERISPGSFDVAFHSHQIMHVGTSLGSYFTYVGLAQWELAAAQQAA